MTAAPSDEDAIAAGIQEVRTMLELDGVGLDVVEVAVAARRVHLSLDLAAVDCLDCVMPPATLVGFVTDAVRRHLRGDVDVVVDDPRTDG